MAADQRNIKWYRYVDDSARNWALRADAAWGDGANSGLAAFNAADPPFGPQSRRHKPRHVVYTDSTTFRSVTYPVGTAAAFAAAPATVNVHVPGLATDVVYSLSSKIGEKLQIAKTARNAPDHA